MLLHNVRVVNASVAVVDSDYDWVNSGGKNDVKCTDLQRRLIIQAIQIREQI